MKVTLKHIADKAGVSVNTVSLALRNMPVVKADTREFILKIAEDMGYFAHREHCAMQNICLISTGERLRDSYFYMSFHQHILNTAHHYDYNMMIYKSSSCDVSPEELKREFAANAIKGILILGDMEEHIVEKIRQCGIPLVALSTYYSDTPVCTLCEDNRVGAYYAIRYLYERGYREIGFVGSPLHSTGFMARYQGYLGAMAAFELPCVPAHQVTTMRKGDVYDYEHLVESIQSITHMPEAFLCANDNLGMLTAKALHALHLSIPKDVAIIGFDNSTAGKMAIPSLTSIDVQSALQADVAVQKLVSFIQTGQYEPYSIILPVTLAEGDSVGYISRDAEAVGTRENR